MPDSNGWLCGSTKPGINTVSPSSVTATPGAAAWTSAIDPIAVILPVVESNAIARARGRAVSIVMIVAALRIVSAGMAPFLSAMEGKTPITVVPPGSGSSTPPTRPA
jgi:hypothetical protein